MYALVMFRNTLLFCLFASAGSAFSAEGVDNIQFIEGWRGADGKHYSGIHIDLKDGWKTYWRSPQGSGIPPVFTVNRDGDITDVEIVFPKPNLYEEFGEEVLAYTGSVTFPVIFDIKDGTDVAVLDSKFSFAVCSDVCIPLSFTMKSLLPAGTSTGVSTIKAALKAGPTKASTVGLKRHNCTVDANGKSFEISSEYNWPFGQEPQKVVIEYPNDAFWVQPAEVVITGNSLSVTTVVKNYGSQISFLERNAITTSVLIENHIFEFAGC